MGNTEPTRPLWLVANFFGTSRLPDNFVRFLPAWYRVTDVDGVTLTMDQKKGGGIHAFLGHLTAEAASVPGLTELNHHILHPFLSVPVGPYNPYHWLFGCCGELPFEGLPVITKIPVTSFA